ncbi:MAG: type II secretion system protein [Candidatus Saccharimonadales bacterium]
MLIKQQKRHGFTIVELLIVIVVIGILAAITIPAYNGIQQRARNMVKIQAAKSFDQILRVTFVTIPPATLLAAMDSSGGWSRACLGTGYADVNSDGRGDCAVFAGNPYVSVTPAFDALLKTTALPSMTRYPPYISTDGDHVFGPYINEEWVDGKTMLSLEYVLEGLNQKCLISPLIYKNGSTNSLTPSGNPNYTVSEYGVTECWVAVATDV